MCLCNIVLVLSPTNLKLNDLEHDLYELKEVYKLKEIIIKKTETLSVTQKLSEAGWEEGR